MPHVSDYFGKGSYLKAEDVGQGRKLKVRAITDDVFKEDDGSERKKPIMWFDDEEKGFVLNFTNCNAILEIVGAERDNDDLNQAVGFFVVLFKTTTTFGNRRVDCIRVRAPQDGSNEKVRQAAQAAVANANEPGEGDIPF